MKSLALAIALLTPSIALAQPKSASSRRDYLMETMMSMYSTQMSYIGAESKDGGELMNLAVTEAELQISKDEKNSPVVAVIADEALEDDAVKTLRQLATAYTLKQRSRFMRYVSDAYPGNSSVLEDALVSDFRAYNSITFDLRPDRVNVTGVEATVDLRYNMALVDASGLVRKFAGTGSFLFRRDKDGVARLTRMTPMLFGNTLSPTMNPVPVRQGVIVSGGGTAPGFATGILSGSVTLTQSAPGFRLDPPGLVTPSSADVVKLAADLNARRGIVSIGACSLESVNSVPSGFSGTFAPANVGECYAVRTGTGKYAVLRVTSLAGGSSGLAPTGIAISYLVQTNGTNSFR